MAQGDRQGSAREAKPETERAPWVGATAMAREGEEETEVEGASAATKRQIQNVSTFPTRKCLQARKRHRGRVSYLTEHKTVSIALYETEKKKKLPTKVTFNH